MCTLVFLFLLTSLLAETARKEANERQLPPIALPEMAAPAGTPGEAAPRPVITIGTGPSYFLNDAPAALSDITTELARTPGAEVEIRGDQGVEYGLVITVVDACRQAGAARRVPPTLCSPIKARTNNNESRYKLPFVGRRTPRRHRGSMVAPGFRQAASLLVADLFRRLGARLGGTPRIAPRLAIAGRDVLSSGGRCLG
jgi:biopolymer transport protein ExbD